MEKILGYALKDIKLFDKDIQLIQNYNFNHLELSIDNVDKESLFYNVDFQNKVKKIKKTNNYSLSIHSFGGINLAEKVNRVRETCTNILLELLEISEELGSRYFVLHLGYCGFHSNRAKKEKRLDIVIQELNYLLNAIESYDIKIAIENSIHLSYNKYKSYLGDCVEDFIYIFDRINHEKLYLVFDIGHFNINCSVQHRLFMEKFKNRIIAYHINWNDGIYDLHLPITVEWVNQFKDLYNFLKKEAINGKTIIFENYSTDQAQDSLKVFIDEF